MIIEHAELSVAPELSAEFEKNFAEAKQLIANSPGFQQLSLARGVERPEIYLLRIEWNTLDDHLIGFRESAAFPRWRELLHHFYQPTPVVEHFSPVFAV